MAAKKYFVDIDLNKNQLLNTVLENTTEATVGEAKTLGQIIFDTGTKTLKYFDGVKWQSSETRLEGALQYKGPVRHDTKDLTIQQNAQKGDLYVFSSPEDGSAKSTVFGDSTVERGDFAIWNGTSWDIIQGNTVDADDSQKGVVKLATTDEFNNSANNVVITPAHLYTWANQPGKALLRKEVITDITIKTDGTTMVPYTIPNGNPTVRVYDEQSNEIEVSVEIVNGKIKLTANSEIQKVVLVVMA